MSDTPQLIEHRREQAKAAIVFIHGFGGDATATWGNFPSLLEADQKVANWDIYSLGYSTSLAFDIAGIWSADPSIITLGGLIETVTSVAPLNGYQGLALVAHSMGGLLLQRALLSNATLRSRVSHVLLFGTPSSGLEKASPFQFWKRQIRDMAQDSPFITELRTQWAAEIGDNPPFAFISVAGDRDEFVPTTSSLAPFPKASQRVVYGNHLQIVKPENANHLGFKVLVKALVGDTTIGDFGSAMRAVESRDFQRAIDTLWPIRLEIDDDGLVALALALQSVGRQNDAIDLLSTSKTKGTDPLGALAGALKRRWLAERRRADGEKALALYQSALSAAEAKVDAPQAFYHAINCAFMNLAFGSDITAAREYANKALVHCTESGKPDIWRFATEGEAYLYLGDVDRALQAYAQALALGPKPRQAASMYQQATRAADLIGEEALVTQLAGTFGQGAAV